MGYKWVMHDENGTSVPLYGADSRILDLSENFFNNPGAYTATVTTWVHDSYPRVEATDNVGIEVKQAGVVATITG